MSSNIRLLDVEVTKPSGKQATITVVADAELKFTEDTVVVLVPLLDYVRIEFPNEEFGNEELQSRVQKLIDEKFGEVS